MWIFSRHGFVDLVQHPHPDHADKLLVRAQVQEDMAAFVALLDEAAGQPHAVEQTYDGSLRFTTVATKETVAKVVSDLVANIDYTKFKQSAVHFDLGAKSSYVVWLGPNDLQVTKLLREP
ncbi:MAG: hypothetical protein GX575_11475 [Candidatus Anammoximicrobium sp.]|nr:hypothetical protein [Candidatus Anammoximicrobium sp.]